MAVVFLGLGSNLGNREQHIQDAVLLLGVYGIRQIRLSTLIETDPVGGPLQQCLYLNAVLKAETMLPPLDVLRVINKIEHELGRIRTVKDGPRTIDIDILLYDKLVMCTPELIIPHPMMHMRDFVMRPLRQIEPDVIIPPVISSFQGF